MLARVGRTHDGEFLSRDRKLFIQSKIQLKHIDARFSQKTKLPVFCMRLDEFQQFIFGDPALFGHARHLELSASRSDVGIQARAGSRNQIDGNGLPGFSDLQGSHIGFYAVDQLLIRGPKIAA